MDEVYPSSGGLLLTTNAEETLQFGDFGSVIVQSADEIADLSMNYVEEGSVGSSDLSSEKSEADKSVAQESVAQDLPEAENEQRLFTMEEVLRIVEFSHKVLKRREVVPPVSVK